MPNELRISRKVKIAVKSADKPVSATAFSGCLDTWHIYLKIKGKNVVPIRNADVVFRSREICMSRVKTLK